MVIIAIILDARFNCLLIPTDQDIKTMQKVERDEIVDDIYRDSPTRFITVIRNENLFAQ